MTEELQRRLVGEVRAASAPTFEPPPPKNGPHDHEPPASSGPSRRAYPDGNSARGWGSAGQGVQVGLLEPPEWGPPRDGVRDGARDGDTRSRGLASSVVRSSSSKSTGALGARGSTAAATDGRAAHRPERPWGELGPRAMLRERVLGAAAKLRLSAADVSDFKISSHHHALSTPACLREQFEAPAHPRPCPTCVVVN